MSNDAQRSAGPVPEPVPMPGVDSWKLTRNCAIAPSTFFWNIAALGLVPLLAGAGFWVAGYPWVMLFCVCQLVALIAAALVHARHATDGERVQVQVDQGMVRVEASCGGRQRMLDVHACWVRLERTSSGSLLLRSGRVELPLGEQLTPERRGVFAEEFAASLARASRRDPPRPQTRGRQLG